MRVGLPHDRQYDPPVPADTVARWAADVAALAPRTDALTWLHLTWEPGDPWEPVERFVVWQMHPMALYRPDPARGYKGRLDLVLELTGPAPRSTGHLCLSGRCLCPIKANAWTGGAATMIDQREWELFRETGAHGKRWWVVQGTAGGHQRRWTNTQRRLAMMAGLPADPPAAGDLPYAPVDGRVLAQIAARDRMRSYGLMTDFLHRTPDQMDAEEVAGAEEAQRQLLAWTAGQVRDVLDAGGRRLIQALGALPRPVGHRDTTDYEAEERALLSVA